MFSNQQSQSPPDVDQSSQEKNLPSWTQFHLEKCLGLVEYSAGVIMGHYLVVLAHDVVIEYEDREHEEEPEREQSATLLAFNLQDHTVQQAKIDDDLFVPQRVHYSFLKYGDNQIIKYGSQHERYGAANMICITVESFEPFKVKCEKIDIGKERRCLSAQAAQIYKDKLYAHQNRNQLWSFDLKNRAWKLCETTGEVPEFENLYGLASFIYQDHLYIYGAVDKKTMIPHLFMLDFSSMTWKKIGQQEKYLGARDVENLTRFGGTVYQGHLVTLENFIRSKTNTLCFLNLQTQNTWSTFDIKGIDEKASVYDDDDCDDLGGDILPVISSLMTYKNFVLSLTAPEKNRNLVVAMMNVDNFGISAPKSADEEYLSGLFLSQNESDIAFKIEEKVIPAHKKILMKKSRYFENLFNSGMAESTQDVIEIKDCEYEIFKEYLQWIYQGTVNPNDANQAMKLYILADKYLQEDLREKCLDVLTSILNMENVYTILDFAHQENVSQIKIWCTKLFNDKLTIHNVAGLIQYLDRQETLENKKGFRDQALNFVLDNFFAIYENEKGNDIQIYEKFLLKNIEIDTILPLAQFIGRESDLSAKEKGGLFLFKDEEEKKRRQKEIFEKSTVDLKEAIFSFVEGNAKVVMASEVAKDFPHSLLRDLLSYTAENLRKTKTKLKRMEPSQNGLDEEESHELKKTKK